VLVVVLRPRESRCLTIRLTGQNNCETIGLFRWRKRLRQIEDEDDDEHEDEDPNFGINVK
jgi:hypothetical protein